MKSLLIPVVVLLIAGNACAQKLKESDVPAEVKKSFSNQFPGVKNVKWSRESDSEFEAEFKSSQGEQSANFDKNGNWIITETEISEKSLPTAVQSTIKKEFAGYEIEESEKAETPGNDAFFEIELKQGKKTVVVQISPEGKVLKTE